MEEPDELSGKIDLLKRQYTQAVTAYGAAKNSKERDDAKALMNKVGAQIAELQTKLPAKMKDKPKNARP